MTRFGGVAYTRMSLNIKFKHQWTRFNCHHRHTSKMSATSNHQYCKPQKRVEEKKNMKRDTYQIMNPAERRGKIYAIKNTGIYCSRVLCQLVNKDNIAATSVRLRKSGVGVSLNRSYTFFCCPYPQPKRQRGELGFSSTRAYVALCPLERKKKKTESE